MGAIQSSINQVIGAAGRAAVLGKAMDIMEGQKLAESSLPGVETEAKNLEEKAAGLEEEAFHQSEAEKQAYQEEHGLSDEQMEMIGEEEMKSVTAVGTATQRLADAAAYKAVQKKALAQRLEDVRTGKNKAGKGAVKDILKEDK